MPGKPAASTGGVLWDMDGVIADTGPYHFKSWQKVFRERGVSFTEENFKRNFGQRNDTIIRYGLGELPATDIELIAREKEETFRKLVRSNLKPLPGVIDLIKSLGEHGFKVALASSGPIENIRLITRSLGIYDYFDAIVYGHEVAEGKPSPLGFLLAAQKIGIKTPRCVVIEDSIAGITAAKRAGMHSIAVTTTHPREKLSAADLVVDSLEEVSIKDIERLISP